MKHFYLSLFACTIFFGIEVAKAEVGVTDTEIVIGAHTSESGAAASHAIWATAQTAYYDMINEQGGVNGRKIRFIRKDTQSLAPKSVEAIKDLVENEKVFAIVGCSGTSHMAVYKYLDEKGVPDLYFADFSKDYTNKKLKYMFPMFYTAETEAKTVLAHVFKNKKAKKLCVLHTKDAYGEEYLKGAKDAVAEFNKKAKASDKVELAADAGLEKMATQADTDVGNFKQAKCDVVAAPLLPPLAASAVNYAFNQGYKPLWIVTAYSANSKFVSLLNDGAQDGILSLTHFARDKSLAVNKKGWDDFEALMKKNNIAISGTSSGGYTMAETFVETLRRAGKNLTRESLAKAAAGYKNWSCSLCSMPLSNSSSDHTLAKTGRLIVTKDKMWNFVP